MAQWLFTSNRQSWGADDSVWTGDEGRPAGCLQTSVGVDISGLSTSVTPSSPCSFWAKIVWDAAPEELETPETVNVTLVSNGDLVNISGGRTISSLPYDSGWFKVFGNAADTGTVTALGLNVSTDSPDWPGVVYFDSVYVAETEPESSEGRFYQGIGSLTERFDMPFPDVSAPALALRQDGAVAIGNGTPGAIMVITTGPTTYTSYINQTNDHAAEGIKRTIWIK